MKYIVMECHEAYAILMDEESRFFHAANLHYSVGQTVTSPLLMQRSTEENAENAKQTAPRIRRIVMRVSAAAACLLLTAGAGYFHYIKNYRTESVIILNSDASIQMYLNQEGKVVRLKSENDAGTALLESYDGRHKNKVTVAHELLALQKANGSISDGDTVDVYISAQDSDAYDTFKSELEDDISKLKLHANVQDLTAHPGVTAVTETVAATEPEAKPAAPVKPEKPEKPEKPAKPGAEPGLNQPAPPQEHKKPDGQEKPAAVQPPEHAEPPAPPAEPPVPPEHGSHSEPKADQGNQEGKTDAGTKPDKADPEPVKPEKPGLHVQPDVPGPKENHEQDNHERQENAHPDAENNGLPENTENRNKQPKKLVPPHLQAHPEAPETPEAPHPLPKPERI